MADATEIRCPNRILFAVIEDGVIEVKCRSNRCGARPGVVVLHRFSSKDGKLLDTKMFRDPATERK